MKHTILTVAALLAILVPVVVRAQLPAVNLISNVQFYTDSSRDLPVDKHFGFGTDYTNGPDYNKGETDVPGPPPQSFYVLCTDRDIGHNCIMDRSNMDIRGVPDSVQSGRVKYFTLIYEFEMWRNYGPTISCFFNWGMPRGIDSVNMQDLLTGSIFNHTFYNVGGRVADTAVIGNEGVAFVKMTVYYNIERLFSGVQDEVGVVASELRPFPNPARAGGRIGLGSFPPLGSTGVLTDALGTRVGHYGESQMSSGQIQIPDVPAGIYELMVIGRDGRLLRTARLAVVR